VKSKYLLGAAAAAIVLAGAGLEIRTQTEVEERSPNGVAFLNPLLIAQSLCGGAKDGLAKRRAFFMRAATAYADQLEAGAPDAEAALKPVGAIAYSITTSSEEAQTLFNAGLAHTYNFNHGAAVVAFKAAQEADPDCAMCYWGEAFALGPNINAPMAEEAAVPAYTAYRKAESLRDNVSEKERELITALSYRYEPQHNPDRAKLDNAFADAMDEAAKKFPEDNFIASLAAEANMDTQAWDYWMTDRRTPKGRTARTISLIEGVLARDPQSVAAIHLYIHITENTQNPYRAAKFADQLADLSPGLGHLIHMPSHTYFKIGRFKQSIASNIEAVAADEAFLNANDANPLYEYGYYTHNIHFVMTSAQMAGDGATALAMAEKLNNKLPAEMAAAVPFAQPIKAAPYYAMAQFAEPQQILDLPDPGAEMPFLQGAWHYARGEAYARTGDADKAHLEAEAIAKIVATADLSVLEGFNIPALDILNIARSTVVARASALEDDLETAIEAMGEAVALQDSIAYTEPPFWYYPSRQTLAAMVLKSGDAERAEQLFLEALVEAPNNGWVLYGLAESYAAQGDKNGRKYARGLMKNAWIGNKDALDLSRL